MWEVLGRLSSQHHTVQRHMANRFKSEALWMMILAIIVIVVGVTVAVVIPNFF